MLKVLLTIDEEIVERAESKSTHELEIANNVKDAMRVETVPALIAFFKSVLEQYQQVEPKVVQQTLQVCAQLVDWNSL
jgi:pantothenate kinase type III